MSELLTLVSLLFIASVGFIIIKFFDFFPDISNTESIFYSFGLGVGIISFQMFLYSLLAFRWSLILIIFPWLLIFIVMYLIKPDFLSSGTKLKLNFKLLDKFFLILILLLLLFVLFEALIRPLSAWDGWASWLLKAKIFFLDGSINSSSLNYLNSEYPFTLSLISALMYMFLGGVNDRLVLLLSFAFYFCLTGIFFFSLRRFIGNTFSLFFTFLLIASQNLIRHGGRFEGGQADLPLSYFIFASSVLLFNYIKGVKFKILILLNIFLGISSLIKNEGLPFALIVQAILIYFILKRKLFKHLYALFLYAIPVVYWQIFKYLNHLPKNWLFEKFSIHLDSLMTVILEIIKEFFNFQNWNLLWVVFFSTFILYLLKAKEKRISIFYLIIFFQLFTYLTIFLITPYPDPSSHVENVMDRLLIHLAPLAVFVSSIVVFSKTEKT